GGVGFKEQRDDHHSAGLSFGAPDLNLSKPAFPDAWLDDGFELPAPSFIGKNLAGEFIAADHAIGGQDCWAEMLFDFLPGWLAWFDNFAGELIGINNGQAALVKQIGGRGFSHSDAASQSDEFHPSL